VIHGGTYTITVARTCKWEWNRSRGSCRGGTLTIQRPCPQREAGYGDYEYDVRRAVPCPSWKMSPILKQTGGLPGFPESSSLVMNGTSDTIRNRHAEPERLRRSDIPIPQHRLNDIEPAFLSDRDYPPGWMVYHRILGVVPKTEADLYDL
jgi:hypothetical protein